MDILKEKMGENYEIDIKNVKVQLVKYVEDGEKIPVEKSTKKH